MRIVTFSIVLFISFYSSAEVKCRGPVSAEFEDLIFEGMENFTVEKSNDKVHIGFDYIIENPNKLNLVIKPSSLFLTIADKDCGWVRIDEKIKLKKKSKGSYPFVLVGDASNFVKSSFATIWNIITVKGIAFNIKGDISAGIAIFKKKWPVDYTYNMTNKEFMSFF
jgi:hypothetical protein